MSTHYHAFQARGFAFSIYEPQVEQWHSHFAGFDPAQIAATLHLTYDEHYLYLTYLWNDYRLRLSDGVLERLGGLIQDPAITGTTDTPDARWTDELFFNECMSIYHHLAYTAAYPRKLSGTWVPSALLEGGAARNDRRPDPLLTPFAARFSEHMEDLALACERLQGRKLAQGDVSYQFSPFPEVPVQIIFWDRDEDFPAQVQVLADPNSVDYMHRETIGCIVSDLLERIQLAADLLTGDALLLRPHHGMCMAYFQGKGYSEDFTAHMTETLAKMARSNPYVFLNISADTLCTHCPFLRPGGKCESQDKVCRYDREVLAMCKLPEGSVLRARQFRKLVKDRILTPGARESICGDCSWNKLCR